MAAVKTEGRCRRCAELAAAADAEPDDRYDFSAAGIFYRQYDVYERNKNHPDQAAGGAEFRDRKQK